MQHTWKAYYVYHGPDESIYESAEFIIPDSLFEQIQRALGKNQPLSSCDFYGELLHLADGAFSLEDRLERCAEKPEREDYDGDDEYEEALEYYRSEMEDMLKSWTHLRTDIEDPGDLERFRARLTGKRFAALDTGEPDSAEFELDQTEDRVVRYALTLDHDENGFVTYVTLDSCEGLEWESDAHSSWAEAYPDYAYLEQLLNEELNGK